MPEKHVHFVAFTKSRTYTAEPECMCKRSVRSLLQAVITEQLQRWQLQDSRLNHKLQRKVKSWRLSFPTQLIPSSIDCKCNLPQVPASHRHWVSCIHCVFLPTPPMSCLHKQTSGMRNTAIASHSFSSYTQEKARFNLACLLGLFTHFLQHAESTAILNTNSFL